jgi:hypothetical protein
LLQLRQISLQQSGKDLTVEAFNALLTPSVRALVHYTFYGPDASLHDTYLRLFPPAPGPAVAPIADAPVAAAPVAAAPVAGAVGLRGGGSSLSVNPVEKQPDARTLDTSSDSESSPSESSQSSTCGDQCIDQCIQLDRSVIHASSSGICFVIVLDLILFLLLCSIILGYFGLS